MLRSVSAPEAESSVFPEAVSVCGAGTVFCIDVAFDTAVVFCTAAVPESMASVFLTAVDTGGIAACNTEETGSATSVSETGAFSLGTATVTSVLCKAVRFSGSCSGVSGAPFDRQTIRSAVFCSSRMLPGQ